MKFIEYIFIKVIWNIFSLFPFSIRVKVSQCLSAGLFSIFKKNTKLIDKNLRASIPGKTNDWYEKTVKKNIQYLGRFFSEFIHMSSMKAKFIDKTVVSEPDEAGIKEYFKDGGIIILGHLGNWEWHGSRIGRWLGDRFYVLAKRQSNKWSNALIERNRSRQHMKTVYTDQSTFKIISLLRKKNTLCFVADQFAGGEAPVFEFFGRRAATYLGPAMAARVSKSRVFFAHSHHKDGKLHVVIDPLKTPDVDPKKDPEKWDRQMTDIWLRRLEECVVKYPEEYFWVHDRWKVTRLMRLEENPGKD